MSQEIQRMIQEYVPGKQVTLAHIVVNPDKELYPKLGFSDTNSSIGILTITPSEGAIIAADIALKAGDISIGYIDRFSGSLVITGDVSAVEASVVKVLEFLKTMHGMAIPEITKS